MLEIHSIDGRNCPVITCDMCGECLDHVGAAAVVFQNFSPPGSKLRLLHVHKGSIDGKTCHREAEALLGTDGAAVGWQEMRAFLTDLISNAGFPPADALDYESRHSPE